MTTTTSQADVPRSPRSPSRFAAWALGVFLLGGLAVIAADFRVRAGLDPVRAAHATERAAWSVPTPRRITGDKESAGDARQAIEAIVRRAGKVSVDTRKIGAGTPLTSDEQAALRTFAPLLPELRAALDLGTHTRASLSFEERQLPVFVVLQLHAALAWHGEHALDGTQSGRIEGTEQIVAALALSLEWIHRGTMFDGALGTAMLHTSCAQLERRFGDLDRGVLTRGLARLDHPGRAHLMDGERLAITEAVLPIVGESSADPSAVYDRLKTFRGHRAGAVLSRMSERMRQIDVTLAASPPDLAACEAEEESLRSEVLGGFLIANCRRLGEIAAGEAKFLALKARAAP